MTDLPDFMRLWDYNDPATSEQRFRALLETAASSGDLSYLASLRTQIARAQCLQGRFADAHATLDRVTPDLARLTDALPHVRYLLERGRTYNDQGEAAAARQHFLDALNEAKAAGLHGHAVDALHMLGVMDPPEEGLLWTQHAIGHAAFHADDAEAQRWLNTLHNNLGWTLVRLQRHEEAFAIFTAQRERHRAAGRTVGMNIARWSAAKVLRLLGRVPEALAEQQALLTLGPTGYRYEEMGECLLALGRGEEARPHFAQAHALLKDDVWLARGEPARLERLGRLGSEAGNRS